MNSLILVAIFLSPFSFSAQAKEGFHLCYFSLNNEKEFQEMEKFTNKLNRFSHYKITVSEHLTEENRKPEEAFEQMVKSTHCDGLVISGHHTGAFGGSRADGSLRIDFLEKLSCQKEYEKWFRSIHSLWLQGCRTLGVGKIESLLDEIPAYDPDYHTQRVGQALEEDGLEQGLADLNMEFSATLDQDNPLSSRYLRTFSQAKVFGWTKTAPGTNSKSEYSIPFHIAHISKLLEKEEAKDLEDIGNPLDEQFAKTQVQSYLNALEILLGDFKETEKHCEDLAVDAWLDHGRARGKVEPYSFANPDLQAYPKLLHSDNDFQNDLKAKECALKRATTKQEVLAAIEALIAQPRLIQFGFNSIWEALQRNDNEDLKNAIREKLKTTPNVMEFIQKKLASKQLGILRKIDYYGFYRDLLNKENPKFRANLAEAVRKIIAEEVSDDNYAARDYRQTLIYSAVRNRIFSPADLNKLIEQKGIRTAELNSILDAIDDLGRLGNSPYGFEQLKRLIKAENSNNDTLRDVAWTIISSKDEIKNSDELLEEILASEKSHKYVLYAVVKTIQQAKFPVKNADQFLLQIAKSPYSEDSDLREIAITLNESPMPMDKKIPILEAVLAAKNVDSKTLREVVSGLAKLEKPFPKSAEYFATVLNFARTTKRSYQRSETAGALAIALIEQKVPAENTDRLLQEITDKGLLETQEKLDFAKTILHSETGFAKRKGLFETILQSGELEENGYKDLINEILSDKVPEKIKAEALRSFFGRPSFAGADYTSLAKKSIKAPPFAGKEELLAEIITTKLRNGFWFNSIFLTLLEKDVGLKDVETLQMLILDSPKMYRASLKDLKEAILEKNIDEAEKKRLIDLIDQRIAKQKH